MAAVRDHTGVTMSELNLGGGHAAPYPADLPADDDAVLAGFADRLRRVVASECAQLRLPVPHLVIESGRPIVSRATIALHRVLAVAHDAEGRMLVAVDGILGDGPHPGPYWPRHPAHAVRPSSAPMELVTMVGWHHAAGDAPAVDAALPADVRPGDLVAVPGGGAYNQSLAPAATWSGDLP